VTERRLRAVSAILAAAGAAIAAYLLYVRTTGSTIACPTGGCETVQSSRYSEIFGIPVAAFGLAGFAGLFATAVAHGERARTTHVALALGAAAFTGYLLYLQGAVIGAFCAWCLGVDVVATAIAALALARVLPGAR
jgi:uncharacterized membrane protein